MTIPIISSTSNAQVKQLIQLQKKAKLRAEQDVFIVEGIKMYQEVPQKRLVHTYASESFYNKKRELFDGKENAMDCIGKKKIAISGMISMLDNINRILDRVSVYLA